MQITVGCFGPCVVPACPATDFHVCNGDSSWTGITIHGPNPGESATMRQVKSSTNAVGAYGILIEPCEGKTWGTVLRCEDVCGSCV